MQDSDYNISTGSSDHHDSEDAAIEKRPSKTTDEPVDAAIKMSFDVDKLLDLALKSTLLDELTIKLICLKAKDIFMDEENVIKINSPVSLVGDVHGQFHDLIEIFKIGGELPFTNYLFLGDYVDRGAYSIETIWLLILFKLKYPQRINLLRGNHETRQITQVYGCYAECQRKFGGPNVWKYITDLFDYLPIAAIIDDTMFCVHGGLSPFIQKIDQIKDIDRIREIPHEGPFADLMWSDPDEMVDGFKLSNRGAGYNFGASIVKRFLHWNKIEKIYRAHQLCMEGYKIDFDGTMNTVWSAPNYWYRFGNLASILEMDEYLNDFYNVYSCSPENKNETKERDDPKPMGGGGEGGMEYFL